MGGDEKRRGRRGEKNKLNRDPRALGGEHGVSGCSPPPRVSPPCRPPPCRLLPSDPRSTGVNRAWVIVWQSCARSVTPRDGEVIRAEPGTHNKP